MSLVCHVTSLSHFSRDKGVTVTRLSHFFKLRGVTVTCHTCDMTVTSLSRPVCHCRCISACGEYYLSVPDWYFSRIGRIQRRPPVSKLIPAICIKIKWLTRKVTKIFRKFTQILDYLLTQNKCNKLNNLTHSQFLNHLFSFTSKTQKIKWNIGIAFWKDQIQRFKGQTRLSAS